LASLLRLKYKIRFNEKIYIHSITYFKIKKGKTLFVVNTLVIEK